MHGYTFTAHVRNALIVAREEAIQLGCDYVTPEHLLLGRLAQQDDVGATALAKFRVTRETITQEIRNRIRRRPQQEAGPDALLPYTSEAKEALADAMIEASMLGHPTIGTEHLVLGIVRNAQGDVQGC